MAKVKLTEKQTKILKFINERLEKNDKSITLQQIASKMKISSIKTVRESIKALKEKGVLKKSVVITNPEARTILGPVGKTTINKAAARKAIFRLSKSSKKK